MHTHMEAELPTIVMVCKGEDQCGPSPEDTAMISIMLVLLEEGQALHELDTVSCKQIYTEFMLKVCTRLACVQ